MISQDTAATLLHELCYLGDSHDADTTGASSIAAPLAYGFTIDFDSSILWPDCPFDTSAAANRYPESSRAAVLHIIESAMSAMRVRAPRAQALVNEHLDVAVVRRAHVLEGASSSSNRAFVGYCTLTNIEAAAVPAHVCMEALVHESMHQYMYRLELEHGNFCDLGETRRLRSPWSGSRIPLHSLVHATFVWFGLSTLWTQLALSAPEIEEASRVRDRLAASLFGFSFLPDLLQSPLFPRSGVQPQILALMEHVAHVARDTAKLPRGQRTVGESLDASNEACRAWAGHVGNALEHVGRRWQ